MASTKNTMASKRGADEPDDKTDQNGQNGQNDQNDQNGHQRTRPGRRLIPKFSTGSEGPASPSTALAASCSRSDGPRHTDGGTQGSDVSRPHQAWSTADDADEDTSAGVSRSSDPFRVRGLAEIVAANIRSELARDDLSQEDLAAILCRSRAAISRRINGSVAWSLEDVGKIAEILGMRPHELLERAHRPQVWHP